MIFLSFGRELINLSQVYQIDLKDAEDGVLIAFFYHLAGSTSGGYKVSEVFKTADDAIAALESMGIDIRWLQKPVTQDSYYYGSSQIPTGHINTRLEPTKQRK